MDWSNRQLICYFCKDLQISGRNLVTSLQKHMKGFFERVFKTVETIVCKRSTAELDIIRNGLATLKVYSPKYVSHGFESGRPGIQLYFVDYYTPRYILLFQLINLDRHSFLPEHLSNSSNSLDSLTTKRFSIRGPGKVKVKTTILGDSNRYKSSLAEVYAELATFCHGFSPQLKTDPNKC